MPFKTRRRKESAQERRFSLTSIGGTISYGHEAEKTKTEIEYKKAQERKTKTIDEDSSSQVLKDLLKILIVAAFVIAVQIGLRVLT